MSDKRALLFALLPAAGVVVLAAFYAAENTYQVGAAGVGHAAILIAVYLATAGFVKLAAGEQDGPSRRIWFLFAFGAGVFAFSDSVCFYFSYLAGYIPRRLWVINFFDVLGGVLIGGAFVIKIGRLGKLNPAAAFLLPAGASTAFLAVFSYPALREISKASKIPGAVVVIIVLTVVIDFFLVITSLYVATTFRRGIAAKSWVAIGAGVFLATLADIVQMYRGFYYKTNIWLMWSVATFYFAGYAWLAWGAWYQRVVIGGEWRR